MINPFTLEDPSKVLVVDQSVRPHLYQDVHSLIRTSRLNPIAPSYTPSYVKCNEDVNHQAKEVIQLDDKEEEARVLHLGGIVYFDPILHCIQIITKNWIIMIILMMEMLSMNQHRIRQFSSIRQEKL